MDGRVKVTVVGAGYVGMSLSVLLAQKNDVTVLDIDSERVKKINNGESTVLDAEIENFLFDKYLTLNATLDAEEAYREARYIIITTPTNYDSKNKSLDTSIVDSVVEDSIRINKNALIVIKSTVPIGHTKSLQEKYKTSRIVFSPEFLREGYALLDNLYPSRIIIGSQSNIAEDFVKLLIQGAKKENIEILFLNSDEAEAVKLFANTYLGMRISFFNELDSFALMKNLDTKSIIDGICLDDRIGNKYNNPSFGYGGYCLPKDTKQLFSHFSQIPQTLIGSISLSNEIRKDLIAEQIIKKNPDKVGIYRLSMKKGSDNIRSSPIFEIIKKLRTNGIDVIIYEPNINENIFLNAKIVNDINELLEQSTLIMTNRKHPDLERFKGEIFTRDIFNVN